VQIEKPHRHDIVEPQLAAMVDVFSILIIFLIAGTVMGTTAIILPQGLVPPKSASKESMLTAPQLTIHNSWVQLSFASKPYPLSAFKSGNDPEVTRFSNDVRGYVETYKLKPDSDAINLVADRGLTYDQLFAVIKAARAAGVKAVLFVSLSDGSAHE
jgi:biopolymer transport protein ExbD